ncbi:MAG: hypothetical protein FWF95_00085 [Syntrophorhabdaceae bacterium]|nr:hypothetical protein [Syntrophorhabdaceae bacterium]
MMNKKKEGNRYLIWIIGLTLTLTLALSFGLVACGGGGGGDSSNPIHVGGDTISVSDMQAYCISPAPAYTVDKCPSTLTFSFGKYFNPTEPYGPVTISDEIDSSFVEIENGKVNINIGKPFPTAFRNAGTVFPFGLDLHGGSGTPIVFLDTFSGATIDYYGFIWATPPTPLKETFLSYINSPSFPIGTKPDRLMYLYVGGVNPLTVTGTPDPNTVFNISARPGWNMITAKTVAPITYFETGAPGSEYKWVFLPDPS